MLFGSSPDLFGSVAGVKREFVDTKEDDVVAKDAEVDAGKSDDGVVGVIVEGGVVIARDVFDASEDTK